MQELPTPILSSLEASLLPTSSLVKGDGRVGAAEPSPEAFFILGLVGVAGASLNRQAGFSPEAKGQQELRFLETNPRRYGAAPGSTCLCCLGDRHTYCREGRTSMSAPCRAWEVTP